MIKITLEEMSASCNACTNKNYEVDYLKDKTISEIYNVNFGREKSSGSISISLCPDCLRQLKGLIDEVAQ